MKPKFLIFSGFKLYYVIEINRLTNLNVIMIFYLIFLLMIFLLSGVEIPLESNQLAYEENDTDRR
jgi:hypothetical protein